MNKIVIVTLMLCLVFVSGQVLMAEGNKTCPVMGGNVNKNLFVDVDGYRIYVCCPGCLAPIKANPEKYIKVIKGKGEKLEKAPVSLCTKCGEIKGTASCCKKIGAKSCKKCGLHKGSPGCCKIGKLKSPVLCSKCGEIKGTEKCCKLKIKKPSCSSCGGCGMY
ncbi:hypothetical protein KAJ27_01635 [bacterium]|nr:hypothetical protein [bacterium]